MLSVSSVGSLGLKPTIGMVLKAATILSVSSVGSLGLKQTTPITRPTGLKLSVSSVGSLGLKRPSGGKGRAANHAFSILSRIVGVETQAVACQRLAYHIFQYPQSDRWG